MRALTVTVLGVVLRSLASAADANVVVHSFPAPGAGGAVQMARAGRGEIWFPQPNSNSLARVNPDGTLTETRLPIDGSRPLAISRDDPDGGRIIFTEIGTNRIGVFDSSGHLTEYDIPTPASSPRGVAGFATIWFTEYDGNKIGRFQPDVPGSMVEFPIPTFASGPLGIALGPGAAPETTAVWFTENLANKIGRIDANGAITEFVIPTPDSAPTAIVRGFDGSQDVMYFTETRGNKIGKITGSGQITEYTIPTPSSSPGDIVFDESDPGVWFTERSTSKLAWLSVDGDFREFLLPGGARPEGLVLPVRQGLFRPPAVWYLDGTQRRVGRLSDTYLFAVGAGHFDTRDTVFEISNTSNEPRSARVGWPSAAVDLLIPGDETAEILASAVPTSEGRNLFYVTGIGPEISDVPETRAWVVDESGPAGVRIELPLVGYWAIAALQPPFNQGSSGEPQPSLTFPGRRRAGVRTSLVLAAIESEDDAVLALEIEAVEPGGDVVASLEVGVPPLGVLALEQVLSDLGIFGDFDGHLRVKRISRSGLFWGVAEIYENDVLTRLMPPGSELEPECTGGPPRCHTRRTRVVTRETP